MTTFVVKYFVFVHLLLKKEKKKKKRFRQLGLPKSV
jgi:hypothetical protein